MAKVLTQLNGKVKQKEQIFKLILIKIFFEKNLLFQILVSRFYLHFVEYCFRFLGSCMSSSNVRVSQKNAFLSRLDVFLNVTFLLLISFGLFVLKDKSSFCVKQLPPSLDDFDLEQRLLNGGFSFKYIVIYILVNTLNIDF